MVLDESRENPPLSTTSTSAGLSETPLADASGDRVGVADVAGRRFADLCSEFVEVCLGRVERILPFEFGTECDLEQFGRRQPTSFELVVQFVG